MGEPESIPDYLEADARGTRIRVKAVPGASRDAVAGALGDRLKVRISAPPEGGKANEALVRVLAKALGVRAREVELVSGPTNPEKVFLVVGLAPREVAKRLGGVE